MITTSPKKGTSMQPRKLNFGMQPYFDLIIKLSAIEKEKRIGVQSNMTIKIWEP
jgi:hypothetical protein